MVCAAYEGILDHFSNKNLCKDAGEAVVTTSQHVIDAACSETENARHSANSTPTCVSSAQPQSPSLSLASVSVLAIPGNQNSSKQTQTQTHSVTSSISSVGNVNVSEGMLFLHFLQFYSRVFDPSTAGIGELVVLVGGRGIYLDMSMTPIMCVQMLLVHVPSPLSCLLSRKGC
jgi:hypothetical protein